MKNRYTQCLDALSSIYIDGKYIAQAIEPYMSDSNASIITKVVYGVVENDIQLDYIINQLVKKVKDIPVRIVLKIGAYSLGHLDNIPDYAIVNDCVNLVKSVGFGSASGLVNAVLKKISTRAYNMPKVGDKDYLSVTYSIPQWLVDRLVIDYGETVVSILSSDKIPSTVRVNRLKSTDTEFRSLMDNNNIRYLETVLPNCFAVDYKALNKNKSIRALCVPQGLSSMLVIDSFDCQPDMIALDCCAAPGGKSIYLAEKLTNGHVESWDIHPHRVKLIEDYSKSVGATNVIAKVQDSTIVDPTLFDKFDLVLCDVPCSGIGTMLSKPDVLLNRKEEDIDSLNAIQFKILEVCSQYVKEGGQLIYSTCSILKDENERIVSRFLDGHKDYAISPITLPVESIEGIGNTLLPDISRTDGFYIARINRCKIH